MADKSKNNSKFKSSSILDDISALHNINKPKNSRATGSEYETLAAAFLEQNGHTIITRNYRTRYGEIDIISKCNSTLVFTECKYRSSSKFGDPLEAVNLHKQQKICHTAMNFCVKYGYVNYPCRFDVIAIYKDGTIKHIKNAYTEKQHEFKIDYYKYNNIETTFGILQEECSNILQEFFKNLRKR